MRGQHIHHQPLQKTIHMSQLTNQIHLPIQMHGLRAQHACRVHGRHACRPHGHRAYRVRGRHAYRLHGHRAHGHEHQMHPLL